MKKCFLLLFVLLFSCGRSVRSENGGLGGDVNSGLYTLQNDRISVSIRPDFGGRVVSVLNKRTGEEILERVNPTNLSFGGAFFDVVNLAWPGTALSKYKVTEFGMNRAGTVLTLTLEYNVGLALPDKKGLVIRKTYWLDSGSAVLHSEVELENTGRNPVEFTYWHQSRPSFGGTNKTTWLPVDEDIFAIPFQPGSGGHGTTMHPTAGFAGLTSDEAKSSVMWLFDEGSIQSFWSWHDLVVPTYDLVFAPVKLLPHKKISYPVDLVLLPKMDSITFGSRDTGMAASMNPVYTNGVLTVNGAFYKFTQSNVSGVKMTVELRDMLDQSVKVLRTEQIPAIHSEELVPFAVTDNVASLVHGGYYKIVFTLEQDNGHTLMVCQRYVKMGPMQIPSYNKPLKIVFMWELHQPLYPDRTQSRNNIKQFVNIYRNIADLYLKHPKVRTDICMSGVLLYQLAQYYPDVISKYRQLVQNKTFDIVATGFAHPLFPFIDNTHIERQLGLDIALKKFLFDVTPKSIHFPEMAFTNRILMPLMKNDIRMGFVDRLAIDAGYGNLSSVGAVDYYKPTRIVGTGGLLNALIRDSQAVNILLKKNDRAVDEFVQYLISVEEGNTNGDRVVVVANNGEFIGNAKFMDELFVQLEKIPWLKFATIESVFAGYDPVQTLLAEKINGSWYYDVERQGSSYRLWFDTPMKRQIWSELTNGESILLRVDDKITRTQNTVNFDLSYPVYLFENAWEKLMLGSQSDWLWSGNEASYQISRTEVGDALSVTTTVYDNLMKILKREILTIPFITDLGTVVPEEDKMNYFAGIESDRFKVWNMHCVPEHPTSISAISYRFNIYDETNGIDYNDVWVVFHINGTDKYFKVKADFMFDGSMRAFLGSAFAGYEIECFVYAKDLKGAESISEPFTFKVSE